MNTDWIQTEFLIYAAVVAAIAVGLVYIIQSWRQKRQNAQAKQQGTRRVSFNDGTQSSQRVRLYISIFVIVFVGAYLYFYTNQADTANSPDPITDTIAYPDNAPSSSFPEEGINQTNTIVQEGSLMESVPQSTIEAPMEVTAPELEMELPTHTEGSVGRESIEKMSPVSGNSRKHTPKFRRGLVPF